MSAARRLVTLATLTAAAALSAGCPADECSDDDYSNADCEDEDGDGYCAVCCGAVNADGSLCLEDCDDSDPWVHPYADELYIDGLDANCDGQDAPAREICDNGVDDDQNGLADCADSACFSACQATQQASCDAAPTLSLGLQSYDFDTGALDVLSRCGGLERVLRYQSGVAGELTLTMQGASHYLNHLTSCQTYSGSCAAVADGGSTALVIGPGTTFIVVEDAGSGLPFTLNAQFTPFVCGDGLVAGSEQCDDGNLDVGDGCDDVCALEPFYGTCGAAIELSAGTTSIAGGAGTNLVNSSCGHLAGVQDQTERLFVFYPPERGTLHVALSSSGPASLYARDVCAAAVMDLDCKNADVDTPALLHLPATGGEPLWIFVDGASLADGQGEITTLFTPH